MSHQTTVTTRNFYDVMSESVGFNGTSTQFRSLAPSLTQKVYSKVEPTLHKSCPMLYKFCIALLPRRLSIQLQPLRDKCGGKTYTYNLTTRWIVCMNA